jgi:iron uptake system component EfeO
MHVAIAGAALLVGAGGALFYYAAQRAAPPNREAVTQVTIGDTSCQPNDLTVPAGRTTFEITNASNRTVEWEILDGVMVVEERENITPGLRSRLTARLKPGTYQITCGLLSNPRGTLTVSPSAASEEERKKPPIKAFIGPLSEYRVYLILQSSALIRETEKLAAAIRASDLDAAKQNYLAARLPYRRMEAVTGRFADLKNAIDPIAAYLEKREADPAFTGFHRIEYGLFSQDSLDGLEPVADKLVADVTTLRTRLRELKLAPEDLGQGIERLSRSLAEGRVLQGESRYASSDLAELDATLDGMEKGVGLLVPLLEGAAPDVNAAIKDRLAAVRATLAGLKDAGGYPAYDHIDAQAKDRLARDFGAVADAVAKLNAALGLE